MSFQVRPVDGNKWELVFVDEPDFIKALKMAPESMEPLLSLGIWLIVVFPIWSTLVRHSVLAAVASAKDYGGRFQLGVRPSDCTEEIYKWWPSGELPAEGDTIVITHDAARRKVHISADNSDRPIWLVLRDGDRVYQGVGPRSKEQLNALMEAAGV